MIMSILKKITKAEDKSQFKTKRLGIPILNRWDIRNTDKLNTGELLTHY